MAETTDFFEEITVRIRPAKMQDFNNSENPSGLSSGMRFYLKQPEGGFKAYRVNENTVRHKLQTHIERGLIWVPCTGFNSGVRLAASHKKAG